MGQYDDKIEKALQYLKSPSRISPTGYSPIVYVVYQPEDMLTVRSIIDKFLSAKADFYGFKAHFISMGELLDKYINNHSYCEIWTDPSVSEEDVYNSIKQEIVSDEFLEKTIIKIQEELSAENNPLLVIKDVEMLHPFYMMGVIENKIYNKINTPMLVFYPGETQGTARSFLGLYNQDGNYRSINF